MVFDVTTLVGFHTLISLVALAAGLVAVAGLAAGRLWQGWMAAFLATAFLTSATGFLFPFTGVLPSHIFGAVSLIAIGLAVVAQYRRGFAERWRATFVVSVALATYLDAFVAVVQVFLKVPAAHALAPTRSEPPFAIAQGLLLVAFLVLGALALRRFRPG